MSTCFRKCILLDEIEIENMLVINNADQDIVNSLHKDFPNPDVGKCIVKKTIISNGQVILIGLVKLSSEIILLSNDKVSEFKRGKALLMLEEEIERELNFRGIDECHAFLRWNEFNGFKIEDILKKLGFKESKSDKILVWQRDWEKYEQGRSAGS
jgi:hypothetical protein